MNLKLTLAAAFSLLHSLIFAQFEQLTISNNSNTRAIHYSSNGVVWVAGDGYTWRSANDGDSFQGTQSLDLVFWGGTLWGQTYGILGLSYTTALQTGVYYLGNDALVYRSQSTYGQWAPAYWDNLNLFPPRNTRDIEMGSSRIIAVGEQGRILVSDNNGVSFVLIGAPVSTRLEDVEYLGNNTWIICGVNTMLKSTDNGSTWASIPSPVTGEGFRVTSASGGVVYVWRNQSRFRSTDYGTTWTELPDTPFAINALEALTPTKLLGAGTTDLFVSYDGGQFWEAYELDNYEAIHSFSFYDENHGIAASLGGYLVRTSNGGGPSNPIALMDGPEFVCRDSLVQFTNMYPGNYSYHWEVDGELVATGAELNYAFSEVGTHLVKLVAANGDQIGEYTQEVDVLDVPNVAAPQIQLSQYEACPGASFTLSVLNTVQGVTYVPFNGTTQVGNTLYGNGGTLTVAMTAPSGNSGGSTWQHVKVVAAKTNECTTFEVIALDSMRVVRPSPLTYSYAPIDTVCQNVPTSIIAVNTELGFDYRWNYLNQNTFTPYQTGNGGEITHTFPSISSTYTYNLRARYNALNCTYGGQSFSSVTIVARNASASFSALPGTVAVGTPVTLTNASNLTHYEWQMGPGASYATFNGANPPPVSFDFSRRDTIIMNAQMDSQNSCTRQARRIVDVYDESPFSPLPICNESVREASSVADMDWLPDHSLITCGIILINGIRKLNIKKLDAEGNVLFDLIEPASGYSHVVAAMGIEVDQDGNILVAYEADGQASSMWNHVVLGKGVLIKLSPEAEFIWSVTSSTAPPKGMKVVGSDMVIAGLLQADMTFQQANGDDYSLPMNSTSPFGGIGWIVTINGDGLITHSTRYGKSGSNLLSLYASEKLLFEKSADGTVWIGGTSNPKTTSTVVAMGPVFLETPVFGTSSERMIYLIKYVPGEGIVKAISPLVAQFMSSFEALKELPNGDLLVSLRCAGSVKTSSGVDDLVSYVPSNSGGATFTVTQRFTQQGQNVWRTIDKDVVSKAFAFHENTIRSLCIYQGNGVVYSNNGALYSLPVASSTDIALVSLDMNGVTTGIHTISSEWADFPLAMVTDDCGNSRIAWMENGTGVTFPAIGEMAASSVLHLETIGSSGCSNACLEVNTPPIRDMFVSDLQLDTNSPFGPEQREVSLTLGNLGNTAVNEIVFGVQLNHGEPELISHLGNWQPGVIESDFILSTIQLAPQPGQQLKIWIHSLDGFSDMQPSNDTLLITCVWCQEALNGLYTVGQTAGQFGSVSDAISASVNCGIAGPVEFRIEEGIYREALSFSPIPGASATNRVVFRPESGTVRIEPPLTQSPPFALVNFTLGSSFITLQDLTMACTEVNAPSAVVRVYAYSNSVHFIGCHFIGRQRIASQCLLYTDLAIEDMLVQNNVFKYGGVGYSHGNLFNFNNISNSLSLVVEGNTFINQSRKNMQLMSVDEFHVRDNQFLGWSPSDGAFHAILVRGNSEFVRNTAIQELDWSVFSIDGTSVGLSNTNPEAVFTFDRFSHAAGGE
jgi:hypothetical protein